MPGFSIRNPYFIVVCALILCVVGIVTTSRMPVDMFPVLDQTVVSVATFYPGMPPEQIEKVHVHMTVFNGSVIYREGQRP